MWIYMFRRVIQMIPIVIGVNLLTFMLFFFVNSPDNIARVHLGSKHITDAAIEDWKQVHGYHLPLFYNDSQQGLKVLTETIFYQKSVRLFVLDFGLSDAGRDIKQAVTKRYLPSLQLAIPVMLLGLLINLSLALLMTFFRRTTFDTLGVFVTIVLISISALFYIIAGQYIFAKVLKWFPLSGYLDGWSAVQFLVLPIAVSVFSNLGAGVRWYRSLFLEEVEKDYVRTARSKGLSEIQVFVGHVLRNTLIPILTGIISVLPLLFMGSLLMESFFGIPGLGSYTMDAIREQDFAIVRSMVFLGTLLYLLGLLLTDLSYVLVDPRVKFE